MKPEQIREQERRLAALTYEQSPCRAFHLVPQSAEPGEFVEMATGPDGEGFLTDILHAEARRRLQSVGLSELAPGQWTLALGFAGDQWAAYTLKAMGRSSWSRVMFPLEDLRQAWPEGVVLEPDEAEFTLSILTDLFGLVLPAGEDWLVLVFLANEYPSYEILALGERLLGDEFQRAAYLQEPSPLLRLPRPVFRLEFPKAAPLPRIQFLPARPGIDVDPDKDPSDRLFKEHWVLRLLNPPEKESHHE